LAKLLVLASEPEVRADWEGLLSPAGHQIFLASGLDQAFKSSTKGIDLIIYKVPQGAPWQSIKDLSQDLTLIAIIEGTQEKDLVKARAFGAYLALRWPPSRWDLLQGVENGLERKRLLSEGKILLEKLTKKNKELRGIQSQLKDLSRKPLEEENSSYTVLQSMGSGLIIVDLEGKIASMNQAAERILGYKSKDVEGIALEDLKGDGEKRILNWDDIRGEVVRIDQEVELIKRGGDTILIGFSTSPRRDVRGKMVGAIVVFRDLTEIKKMRENMRYKDRLASLGELIAGIAHEIRNPLAGIKTTAQALKAEFAPQDPKCEYLEKIIKEINRTNSLLQELFIFAKPQKPQFVPYDITKVLERVISMQEKSIEEKGVKIKKDYTPDIPLIPLDPNQIYQVFLNLILNAVQAMPQGGDLTLSVKQERGAWISVTVKDTGVGMSEEVKVKLFDPFFTTKPMGTGLGLAISYRIIQEHGGMVGVESKPGQGAKFTIRLPLKSRVTVHGEQLPGMRENP